MGTTEDLNFRLRRPPAPPRSYIDVAIVLAALILGVSGVFGAYALRDRPHRYEFLHQGSTTVILDRFTGDLSACSWANNAMACTPSDSPAEASSRKFFTDMDAEIDAELKEPAQ
jgi:hypothetical protein